MYEHSARSKCLCTLFSVLLHGAFACFSLFFNLCRPLFAPTWAHGYLFYFTNHKATLDYKQRLLCLFCCFERSSFGHREPVHLALASLRHTPINCAFCFCACLFLRNSLLSGAKRCCKLIFYISSYSPKIIHLSKEFCFFIREWTWKSSPESHMYWFLLRCSCFFSSSADITRNICLYFDY